MAGSAATVVAIGSVAWYYHLYGTELHAMTPAEEGLVQYLGTPLLWIDARWEADGVPGHRESRIENIPSVSKTTHH